MAVHGREELQRVGRVIRTRARASLMSDTKWRKLLSALDRPELRLRQCVVKFVDAPGEKVIHLPIGLHAPRPWIDTFEFGPIPLRAIEWMLFPRTVEYERGNGHVPKGHFEQDVETAALILHALGKFPARLSERGLLIIGHVAEPPAR
jgi:hypothetical protein